MTKVCKRFTQKDKKEIKKWAKKYRSIFTMKEYNQILKKINKC